MHNNVDVAVRNGSELFGEVDCVCKEFLSNGRVEVFNVKYGEGMLIFVLYIFGYIFLLTGHGLSGVFNVPLVYLFNFFYVSDQTQTSTEPDCVRDFESRNL